MSDLEPASSAPPGWRPRDEDLDFFGLTHPGKVRKENQDHFLFSTIHKAMRVGGTSLPNREQLEMPSQRLASFGMVADGVGGHAGGEQASRAALEAIATYLAHATNCFFTTDPDNQAVFLEALTAGAEKSRDAVIEQAKASGDARGMATTLTAAMVTWPHLYLLQVGDSRCYQFRHGVLTQLSRDQTMAQDMVDMGILPAERAANTQFANVLSSSIGGQSYRPVVTTHNVEPGEVLLLCTDGLTKHVSQERIAERLGQLTSSEQACRALVDDALAGGGTDNVTVVILRSVVPGSVGAG